jgi:hypothetical protein
MTLGETRSQGRPDHAKTDTMSKKIWRAGNVHGVIGLGVRRREASYRSFQRRTVDQNDPGSDQNDLGIAGTGS